jgi:hypothetical protein
MSYDDMGNYHDPALRLERTDVAQADFEAHYHPFQHDIPDTRQGFDGNGDYHRMCPDIEGKDPSPYEKALQAQANRDRMVRNIVQQIIGESIYKPDVEWELWDRVRVLEDTNALPLGVTADDLFQHYLANYEGES